MSNRRLSSRFLATFWQSMPTRIRRWAHVSPTGRKYPYWADPTCCFIDDNQRAYVSYLRKTITLQLGEEVTVLSYAHMSDSQFYQNTQKFLNCKH